MFCKIQRVRRVKKKKKMRTVWSALKKSLDCKTNSCSDVHEPKSACKIVEKPKPDTTPKSRSSKSPVPSNADHGNTSFDFSKCRGSSSRRSKSPISDNDIRKLIIEASDFGESARSNCRDVRSTSARFSQSTPSIIRSLSQRKYSSKSPNCIGEFPISSCASTPPNKKTHKTVTFEIDGHDSGGFDGSSSVRTLPYKKVPNGREGDGFGVSDCSRSCVSSEFPMTGRRTPPYRKPLLPYEFDGGEFPMKSRDSNDAGANARYYSFCPQCWKQAGERENVCWKHAVNEVVEEAVVECRSPCSVIKKICKQNWSESGSDYPGHDRVLKINSLQKTKNQYEEYREIVKRRALQQKHSRTYVNGNELRRFHGAILACPLGTDGSSNICSSEKCRVCRILEIGFLSEKEIREGKGVLMTSTCECALQTIEPYDQNQWTKAALIVCTVIAGLPENSQNDADQPEFGLTEDLYVLDPRAILPLYVVIPRQVNNKANS